MVAEIDAAKYLCLKENGLKDAYVRPVAWRGSEMMAVSGMTCCSSGSILTFLLIGLILILSGEGVNTWLMQEPAEGGESLTNKKTVFGASLMS